MNFFWYSSQFSAGPSEEFSKLLANPESPLELVLSADEAVTQSKRRCEPLLVYLTPQKLIELVTILAEEPPTECSFDRGHKFPFAASELLSASAPEILDKVLAAPEVLQHIVTLAERPASNLTSTAYLANVIIALLSRNSSAYQFAFSDPRLSTAVLNNLHSKSMADLAFKLLFLDNSVSVHYLLERFEVIKGLVRCLGEGRSVAEQMNASTVLCDIVRNAEAKSWKLLVCAMVQREELEEVFKSAATGSTAGLSVLNALLSCEVLGELSEINLQKVIRVVQSPEDGSKVESEDDEDREDALITLLGQYLPSILQLLSPPSPQVGSARLQICDLVDTMLKQKSPFFEEIIVKEGGLRCVTELFFSHPLNSFLQKTFESIVHTVVDKASVTVQKHLLQDTSLPAQFAKAAEEVSGPPGNSGLCNMGFVTRISSFLVSKKGELQWWQPDDQWNSFESGYLEQANNLEKPKKRANSDDEAEFNNPEEAEPIPDDESPEDDDEDGEISLNTIVTPPQLTQNKLKKYTGEDLEELE